MGGVPQSGLIGGGAGMPATSRQGGTLSGVPLPWLGGTTPPSGRGGVALPVQDNRWSTLYAVVGMPLAFTQEDFLVENKIGIPSRI